MKTTPPVLQSRTQSWAFHISNEHRASRYSNDHVSNEWLDGQHQQQCWETQNSGEFGTQHACAGTCVSLSALLNDFLCNTRQMKTQEDKPESIQSILGSFPDFMQPKLPPSFPSLTQPPPPVLPLPSTHSGSPIPQKKQLNQSSRKHPESQDLHFYLWLENSDSSNSPFVNRSPKEISPRAPNGGGSRHGHCRLTSRASSESRGSLPGSDTGPPSALPPPALSAFISVSFISEVAQIRGDKE